MRLYYPMKKNGMYLLKKTDFEDIACQVLTEYMPSVFNYPRPTDIEYLAQECLYLDIKHEYIMPDGKVLGMMAFADVEFNTIGYEAERRTIELEEGTMLIDMSLIGTENRARKRFTEAHETSHWICHRSFHSPTNRQYDFRMNKSLIACRTENIERYHKSKYGYVTDEDWEEWQADSLAAALLMPKSTFSEAVGYALRSQGNKRGYLVPGQDEKIAKRVISEVANVFEVSFRAAQIRMIHLGFIRA